MPNYSQDCSLPYGPMKLRYNIASYRHENTKMTKYEGIVKVEITLHAIRCELAHNAVKVVTSKLL